MLLIDIPDGGPLYAETDLSHALVEPWNAFSSLSFWLPVFYWLYRIRGNFKNYPFLLFAMPLLFLGGLGSTLFHAFRTSSWLLLLDVLPIAILTIGISLYLIYKLTASWWWVIGGFIGIIGIRTAGFWLFKGDNGVNLSYFLSGVSMFLPAIIVLYRTSFKHWKQFALSVLLFSLALFFRQSDQAGWQPFEMGTHFLWHLFCGAGAFPLGGYLKYLAELEHPIK